MMKVAVVYYYQILDGVI